VNTPDATAPDASEAQLAAIARLHEELTRRGIDYWLFGGWAVDFHAGRRTRTHADIDLAVWQADAERLAAVLGGDGWNAAPGGPGYLAFERGPVRAEVALLDRDRDGTVFTPAGEERGEWPAGAFGTDLARLEGVDARVVTLAALIEDKSAGYGDTAALAKDRADLAVLAVLSDDRGGDPGT